MIATFRVTDINRPFKSEIIQYALKLCQIATLNSSEQLQDSEQVEEALGILKDDKEFEEFEKESWTASEEESSDLQVWDDKWDFDVEVDDQFTQYLR
ncbi:pre-mRNA-splicing factor ATP-dependent RNA helicase PRP16 isoform 2 [Schistosoma japonicum]|nr:pre-mRNA-splicing factor ATP-dependent RNA helicase PRP16 isoform 2 [Schistosoma japonicum]